MKARRSVHRRRLRGVCRGERPHGAKMWTSHPHRHSVGVAPPFSKETHTQRFRMLQFGPLHVPESVWRPDFAGPIEKLTSLHGPPNSIIGGGEGKRWEKNRGKKREDIAPRHFKQSAPYMLLILGVNTNISAASTSKSKTLSRVAGIL